MAAHVAALVLSVVGRRGYLRLYARSRAVGAKLQFGDVHFPNRMAIANGFLVLIVAEMAGWAMLPVFM